MVGFPNKPMGFPIKNDHFEVEIGGTTFLGNTHIYTKRKTTHPYPSNEPNPKH